MINQYVEFHDEGYWIRGTRISLDSIVYAFRDGLSPETIARDCFPSLSLEEVYGANETANGELGFYVVADGGGKAWRARTRPPSFIHFATFPHLIEGHQISDVPAVLGSLNIIAAELDR